MRLSALVLALCANVVLATGVPPCCAFAVGCGAHAAAPEGPQCPCCPVEDEPAPTKPEPCRWSETMSDLLHVAPTLDLDAPLAAMIVDVVAPPPAAAATATEAPSRDAGPPGPALALPLLL